MPSSNRTISTTSLTNTRRHCALVHFIISQPLSDKFSTHHGNRSVRRPRTVNLDKITDPHLTGDTAHMKRLHILLTLSSINVILVSIERFSPTTTILLQPDNFLRLHEMIQMTLLILFTVIIPAFVLRELTVNFKLLQSKKGAALGLLFTVGIYFYATGNGLHEVASFLLNQ